MAIRKPETISFWCGRLPHWEVIGGRYFITIHTAGAIPIVGQRHIREIAEQLKDNPRQRLRVNRKIFAAMENWLAPISRNSWLQQPEIAKAIGESLQHYQKLQHWNLLEYVVMPNHVHLFLELGKRGMKATLESWKRWTSRKCLPLIPHPPERFWQREWFDHWSRSDEEDERIIAYIRNNPVSAGLVNDYREWPYGSWR